MLKKSTIALACICLPALSFSQVPPLTSTIGGTIWQESKPFDGLRVPSEKKVEGILVKLLDATTQEVVATTLSDQNGMFSLKANAGTYMVEYVYPSDGFLVAAQRVGQDNANNSAPDDSNVSAPFTIGDNENLLDYGLGLVPKDNTLTYCTQKESVVTEWTENLLLPKSTVAPIPLNVKLFAAESVYHPNIGIENTGTANAYSITTAGKVTMNMPIGTGTLVMNSDVSIEGTLDSYDGQEDYSGTSGITFYNRASFASSYPARNTSSQSVITTNFVGSGDDVFTIPTKAQSTVSFTGAGNLKTSVQTYVSAGACVVYTYAEGALPVTLASFSVKKEAEQALLSWSTSQEFESDRFEVQRSSDGKRWATIGTVRSTGTTTDLKQYSFSDTNPFHGQNLYRLKMVDLDNSFAYSAIREAVFAMGINVYPNPATKQISIQGVMNEEIAKISIFSQSGRLVKDVVNSNTIEVSTLPGGIYKVIALFTNGTRSTSNILVSH